MVGNEARYLGHAILAHRLSERISVEVGRPNLVSIALFNPHLSFNPITDLTPITLAVTTPLVAIVPSALPTNNLSEFIVYTRTRKGELNFGGTSGSPAHLAGELLKSMARIEMTFIPYNGIAPAVTAVLGNQIQLAFPAILLARPHVTSGRVRALGVTSSKRSQAAPDWPTIAESGLPGYEANIGFGFLTATGTPQRVIAYLQREIAAVLQLPDVARAMAALGGDTVGNTPEEFAGEISKETVRLGKLILAAGIRVE